MWTRQELKARGKTAFKRNYWKSVGAGAVALVLTGATFGSGSRVSGGAEELNEAISQAMSQSGLTTVSFMGILFSVMGAAFLVGIAISLLLRNPILVGAKRFFLNNTRESASLKELQFALKSGNYLNIVAATFLRNLFIFLWCLLLVVPGIIKSLEYTMVDYILADNPNIGPMEALRESKRMMAGHKWNTFVLGLSFLGWEILNLFTVGLLDIFYVRPYMEATFAELYLELKQ